MEHPPLTSAAVAPRPHSDDLPDAHDPSKGVGSRRSSLEQPTPLAAGSSQGPRSSQAELEAAADAAEKAIAKAAAESEAKIIAREAAVADDDDDGDEEVEGQAGDLDDLVDMLQQRLALGEDGSKAALNQLKREPLLASLDLAGVAQLMQSGRARRIVTMCGAGISVSAGIPDFRTPGTGLYSQLERFGLPEPEAVFSISFFKQNPKPFHMLAKELFPGNYKPTPTHYFIKLLHDKGLLLRAFTQNIDSLEHEAGLPQSAVVAAHGNFDSARCIKCNKEHSLEHVKQAVFADDICHCTSCGGLVKPDIVFFGEQLPARFYERMEADLPACDLLLVMGTSLVVQPFASLIDAVPEHCPRVLLNRERVGEGMGSLGLLGSLLGLGGGGGFTFEHDQGAYRDVLYLGDADEGVRELCSLLGWEQALDALIAAAPKPSKETEAGAGGEVGAVQAADEGTSCSGDRAVGSSESLGDKSSQAASSSSSSTAGGGSVEAAGSSTCEGSASKI
ncbi:DHS-like NAD/FAD-binding domain-containing protein [Scenedesmus sp. NREL 46B-D3]|nr:DHS-like NAD/FAD-binding domain-containing protein [Scenedesmus sp. NREL 46B-D3]